jgi:sugar phosphate isomerase/epimerase
MFTTLSAEDLALEVTFAETIRLAEGAGFGAVDLPMEEIFRSYGDSAYERVQEMLDRAGLRAGGWWLPIEFRNDIATFREGLATLPRAAELARGLGARWCNTWIWPFSDDRDYAENRKVHVDRLGLVSAVLAEQECVLGLEFLGPKTLRANHAYGFIHTLGETLDLIADIGDDNVGVLFDCWQWYTSHGDADQLDMLQPGQVTYVHLNDAPAGRDVDAQIDDERMLPGATGVIDVTAFLASLKATGFDGPIAAEPFNAELNALQPDQRVRVARDSILRVCKAADLTLVDAAAG